MAWLRSRPADGIPWRHTLIAGLGAVLIPALIGAATMGVLRLSEANGGLESPAMMLVLSPFLTGAAMILVVPLAGILLREGWFGWAIAPAIGLTVGWIMDLSIDYPAAAPFGAGVLVIMRALLGRLRDLG